MRIVLLAWVIGLIGLGCTNRIYDPYPDLMETEKALVGGCEQIAVINETADAGNVLAFDATEKMLIRVRDRAGLLGATHIVWLHRTSHSAAAEAYRCPIAQQ